MDDMTATPRVALWNPPAVIRWNTEKGYLRELGERGVRVGRTSSSRRVLRFMQARATACTRAWMGASWVASSC